MATGYKFPIRNIDGSISTQLVTVHKSVPSSDGSGSLVGFGQNDQYNLGNGTSINYSSPIIIGSLTNWKQVSSMSVTAAIKTDGTLWTWGYSNANGGLGNGTTIDYSSPIQVGSLTNWKQAATGALGNVCAIKTDGTLWSWGSNTWLGLGNGNTIHYSSPIQVGSLTNWSQVYPGYYATPAIKTDGTLWMWGINQHGQLGNGTTIYYSSPIQVGSLTNWAQASTGYYTTAAVKTDGTLWVWGRNFLGMLGINNSGNIYYSSPIQVGSLTDWKQVACNFSYMMAVKTDGTLWGWGENQWGNLGNNNAVNYSSPIQIGSLTNWKQVSLSDIQASAIKTDGTLWTWGSNGNGELGDGTTIKKSSPIQVGSLTNWSNISDACAYAQLAIQNSSYYSTPSTLVDMEDMFVPKDQFLTAGLWGWGYNGFGELGNSISATNYSSPVQVGSLTNWKQIAVRYGGGHAIKTDGTLWAWGYNYFGTLGNGTTIDYSSPIQIGSLTNWKQVSSKFLSVAAIKTDGTLWQWGFNSGRLGNGSTDNYSSPIQIGSLTNWKQVDNHGRVTIALKTDGTIWAWGPNGSGELGNGTTIGYSSPIQVGTGTNWKQVACGYRNTAAIKTDGTLWTCGYGNLGLLGNGTVNISYSSPIQVGSLTNWKQIACGYKHNMAIKTDGTLWTWGFNNFGQLGYADTSVNYSSPVQVGSLTNWKQVSGGRYQTVAIKTDGTLWTCGYGNHGALGNNTIISYSSPIQVGSLTNWKQAGSYMHTMAIQAPDYYYNQ